MRHDAPKASSHNQPGMSRIFAEIGIANVSGRFFIPAFTRKADVLAAQAPLGHLYRMCADKNAAMTGAASPQLTIGSCFSHSFSHSFSYFMNES